MEVSVARADDGSLGVELAQDGEGHPTIAAIAAGGPCDGLLRLGDRVLAIDGTETSTVPQVVSELRRNSAATLRVRVRRASAPEVEPKVFSIAPKVAAGRSLDVPLVMEEAAMGHYSFTCAEGGAIDFSILALPPGTSDAKAAAALVRPSGTAATKGEGAFRVSSPCSLRLE